MAKIIDRIRGLAAEARQAIAVIAEDDRRIVEDNAQLRVVVEAQRLSLKALLDERAKIGEVLGCDTELVEAAQKMVAERDRHRGELAKAAALLGESMGERLAAEERARIASEARADTGIRHLGNGHYEVLLPGDAAHTIVSRAKAAQHSEPVAELVVTTGDGS